MFNRRNLAKVLLILVLFGVLVSLGGTDIAQAATCTRTGYPGWNNGITHNKWISVSPTNIPTNGYFLYYNQFTHGWSSVRWNAWGIYGSYVKFGVDTSWTWTHPYWKVTPWRYVYNC